MPEEKSWLEEILESKYIDAFRKFNKDSVTLPDGATEKVLNREQGLQV